MADDLPALSLYLDYEYLAAQQFGDLLLGLHGVFDELLYADSPVLRHLPTAPAARLRIKTVETGSSITVYVIQGVTQMVGSADPSLVGVASGLTALAAAGTLIMRLLHRAEDLRAKWLRDNRANEQQQLDVAAKRLDVFSKELQLRELAGTKQNQQARLEDTLAVLAEQNPDRNPEQQSALAGRLTPHLDAIARIMYDDNIREMRVTLPRKGE